VSSIHQSDRAHLVTGTDQHLKTSCQLHSGHKQVPSSAMQVIVLTSDGTEVFFETVCRLREVGTETCNRTCNACHGLSVDLFADHIVAGKATVERVSGTHIRIACTHES